MKAILVVLLASIALSAGAKSEYFKDVPRIERVKFTPISTEGLADSSLVEDVNNFVNEKVAEFNAEIDQFNNIADDAEAEVDGILEDAKNKIEEFFEKIMAKINELKRRGGIYKKCAEQYEAELKEARLAALEAIKVCASTIAKALKDFAVEVGVEAASITKNVLRLVGIVKNCYDENGILNQAKCAFKAIKEVMDIIVNIVKSIKNLVEAVSRNTKQLVSAVKNCNENYIQVAQAKFKEYDNKVAECYKLEAFFY